MMNSSQMPKVCIYIPTYNSTNTLSFTLDSLLAQTYENIEITIMDNASTDGTIELIRTYMEKNPKVKLVEHEVNIGSEGNVNRCIRAIEGDYAAVFHSDDVYAPTIVEKQVAFLEKFAQAGGVFTGSWIIDENGEKIGQRLEPKELTSAEQPLYSLEDMFGLILKYGNFITCPSVMIRSDIYRDEIQCFDYERYRSTSDLGAWLKLLQNHSIGYIPEKLMFYRSSANSFSYHYKRGRTEKHDLFILLEEYMNVFKEKWDQENFGDYEFLLKKDEVNRAISFLINGDRKNARTTIRPYLRLLRLVNTKNRAKIYVMATSAKLLSYIPLSPFARRKLFEYRYKN
ncbi:hypothetical protein B9G55_10415 [Saccharibacillus sp. O16]|nr:hypothetical protein B9G55_10415 [Saccharibacillus sp. O16]